MGALSFKFQPKQRAVQAIGPLVLAFCLVMRLGSGGSAAAAGGLAPTGRAQPQETPAQHTPALPAANTQQQAPPSAFPPAPFPSPASPGETQPPAATAPAPANQPATQADEPKPGPDANGDQSRVNTLSPLLLKHLAQDQVSIWTSPAGIRTDQTVWLVPLAGITAGFLVTDEDASGHLNPSPSTISQFEDISNYGVYSMIGGAAGLYFLGNITHDDHERETGFLSGEAALDSLAVAESLKYATGRDRPYQDSGQGNFWDGGTSFPSEHAALAWSIAGIVAHEYPGTLTKLLAYGLAGVISASRVEAKQHFPSDALVGSALGYLISEHVYNTRHDPEVGGGEWAAFPIRSEDGKWQGRDMGSPYVPMDSWIYPAFDRLVAMGYANTGFLDLRPWTRRECARLLSEMGDTISESSSQEAYQIYATLENEFADDLTLLGGGKNRRAQLESVYTRSTEIAGKPLTDGFDFGQTIINDFGRPYAQGYNNVTGASGFATEGPWVAYVQWEYQHAPASPSLPESALQLIPSLEGGLPCCPLTTATSTLNRGRLLDAYAGLNLHDWQITYGQQTLWWGPEDGGPLSISDNVQPIPMFRISRVTPFKLPWILGLMGPMRVEAFLGQVAGQRWIVDNQGAAVGSWTTFLNPQPFIHGEKFSFKPTENLEIGFSRTVLFSGQTVPFTIGELASTYFSVSNGPSTTALRPIGPGDRRSFFDLTYRVPGLRKWVEYYADGFTEDQYSPVAYPDRSAWDTGVYFSHLPGIAKMDFRAEGVFTDLAIRFGPGAFYSNDHYHSGYTQYGNIIGSWIGRQGTGVQAWTNYWFTPRRRLQFNFRHEKVSQEYVPLGGTITDGGANLDWLIGRHLSVTSAVQYEKWLFPVIFSNAQTNVTGSMQLTLWPESWGKWPKSPL